MLTSWLSTASSGITVLVFFYAVLALVGTFTYRSDLNLLLMTPVSTRLILATKILGVSFGFSFLLFATIPGLIAIGDQLNLGWTFLPASVFAIILMPIAPVSLATLLVLFILRFVPAARARTVTTFMGTILGAALFIGQQELFGARHALGPQADVASHPPDALPSTWAGHMLASIGLVDVQTALVYGLGAGALALVFLTVAIETSARFFQMGAGSYHDVARRKRSDHRLSKFSGLSGMRQSAARDDNPRRPLWWPLFVKEWLLLRRDSQRLAALSYPLFIIGFYLWQLYSLHNSPILGARGLYFGSLYGVLTVASILLLNSIAPTIVNREGRSIYLLALAPLSARDILLSKWTIAVSLPLILVEGLLVAGALLLQLGIAEALIIAVTMAGLVIALVGVSITINLIWPKLVFTNPRHQGSRIASLVSMASEFILGFCVFGLLSLAFLLLPDQPVAALGVLLVLGALLAGTTSLALIMATRLLATLLVGDRGAR